MCSFRPCFPPCNQGRAKRWSFCAAYFVAILSLSKPGRGGGGRTLVEVIVALVLVGLKGVVFLGREGLCWFNCLAESFCWTYRTGLLLYLSFIVCVLDVKGFIWREHAVRRNPVSVLEHLVGALCAWDYSYMTNRRSREQTRVYDFSKKCHLYAKKKSPKLS